MRKRALIAGVGLAVVFGGWLYYARHTSHDAVAVVPKGPAKPDAGATDTEEDEDRGPLLRPPTGKLPMLTCAGAGTIVKEVQAALAFVPAKLPAHEFASATKNWIDPHGLWAVTSDAPAFAAVDAEGPALLAEIAEGKACPASARVGHKLHAWVDTLRARFDARRKAPHKVDVGRALTAAVDPDDTEGAADAATALADDLADRAAALDAVGATTSEYLQTARDRFFPSHTDDEWGRVVLAAAVRAWVEQTDGHGAWAPYGEEASVHDVDLTKDAPARLWGRAARTLLGVRIDEAPLGALAVGDIVLKVDTMPVAGMSIEQLDELALTAGDVGEPIDVVVLKSGDNEPHVVRVDPESPSGIVASAHPFDLSTERVPYGKGEIAIVAIQDVYDDLGELFARALTQVRSPTLIGIVLDLRGNAGGATEGAIDVLGAFLPGAHLFPMKHRDGTIETDRAPEPPPDEQWTGPVATLVDAGTASAAEMLAGALAAYRRGPSIGALTYGKGCAQEYLDDDVHAGLLRITTLLFAMPDGSPLQRVGLTPLIPFPFRSTDVGEGEREATLPRSPPSWTGPDVRDRAWLNRAPQFVWPAGHVGPCKDEITCKALTLLGDPDTRRRGPVARAQK